MVGISLFLVLVLTFFLWKFLFQKKYPKPLPPGPFQWPIIGNLVDIYRAHSDFPHLAFAKLSNKYGDIMSLKLGVINTVVVSGYEGMSELLTRNDCMARYEFGFVLDRTLKAGNIGISFSKEKLWEDVRKYCVRSLRDFGLGKSHLMEEMVSEELVELIHRMDEDIKKSNGVMYFQSYFSLSTISLIWRFLFGTRLCHEDPVVKRMLHLSEHYTASITFDDVKIAFPAMRHVFPKLTGHKHQMDVFKEQYDYIRECLQPYKTSISSGQEPTSFVEAFLQEIERNKNDPNTIFTEKQLIIIIIDIFVAAFETTGSMVSHLVNFMLHYPEIQEKVHFELEKIIGNNHNPSMAEMNRLPYTQAVIHETMRFSEFLPIAPARVTLSDVYYKEYCIPKDTAIIINVYPILMDKEYWGDPDVFRPQRFLDSSNNLVNTERINALFGFGKRICIGQSLAQTSIPMYFTTLMQRYTFKPVPGKPLSPMGKMRNLVIGPKPFEALVTIR